MSFHTSSSFRANGGSSSSGAPQGVRSPAPQQQHHHHTHRSHGNGVTSLSAPLRTKSSAAAKGSGDAADAPPAPATPQRSHHNAPHSHMINNNSTHPTGGHTPAGGPTANGGVGSLRALNANPSYSPTGGLLFQQQHGPMSATMGDGNANDGGVGGINPFANYAAAMSNNDDVECLTSVSNALGAILDDNIALSRDTEMEAVELLDLAVEVFRAAASPQANLVPLSGNGNGGAPSASFIGGGGGDVSSPFGPQSSPQRAALLASDRALQRVGVLVNHCGILQILGRFYPLKLTIGSRMRVSALKALIGIMQICSEVERAAGMGGGAASSSSSSVTLIAAAMAEAFSPPSVAVAAGGIHPSAPFGNTSNGYNHPHPHPHPHKNSTHYTYDTMHNTNGSRSSGADMTYALCVLACDNSGATSDAARTGAAEALVVACTAWPRLIQSCLIPTLQLASHHTSIVGGGGGGEGSAPPPIGPSSSSNLSSPNFASPTFRNNASSPAAFGGGGYQGPTLALAVVANAAEVDGIVSAPLRVQLCAITRLVAQHGPRLLLSSPSFMASSNNSRQGGGNGKLMDFATARYNAVTALAGRHGGGVLGSSAVFGVNAAPMVTADSTAVQRLVAFLDPRGRLNVPMTEAIAHAEAVVASNSNANPSGGGSSSEPGVSAAGSFTNNPRPDGKPLQPLSFTPTQLTALRRHIRCYVLLMDALTDLLSSSADTIAVQDYSSYWIEVVAVPTVAEGFVRAMDWCLGVTSRTAKDLPPSLLVGGSGVDATADIVDGEEQSGPSANLMSQYGAGSGGGSDGAAPLVDPSSPVAVLTAINEGLIFTAAVSLAKTALLLEGQYTSAPSSSSLGAGKGRGIAFDGATPSHGDGGGPPLLVYRLLVGLDPSFSATTAFSGLTLPNGKVWEGYFARAADVTYFPSAWHRAHHQSAIAASAGVEGVVPSSPSPSAAGGGDPTRHHKGMERLRLIRFALSHAFTAPSMHLLEAVMGGNGFQHASQALMLAQQRLKEAPSVKARTAVRDILRDANGVGGNANNGGRRNSSVMFAAGDADDQQQQSGATTTLNASSTAAQPTAASAAAASEELIRSIVSVMDRVTEALLVEASLLIGIMFAKSPTIRAIASRFAVGYESWALQLASAIESVVSHPRIVQGTLQYLVLVDVCQCILNDGEQARHVDRFDEKRIAAAIVREQEKRRLIAEAEVAAREAEEDAAAADEYEHYGSQEEHDRYCGGEDCGSRYHYRGSGIDAEARRGASRSIPASPHRRRPPPIPTSAAMSVFELDLATVHFLLTQYCAEDPVNRVFSPRIGELCTRLAKEVLIVATKSALIDGPQAIKANELLTVEGQQQAQQRAASGMYYASRGGQQQQHDASLSFQQGGAPQQASTVGATGSGAKRATTPNSRAQALLAQQRPMKTNYDQWIAQRATTPPPGGRGTVNGSRASVATKTIVGGMMPKTSGKEPFRPTSTAPRRSLTPGVHKMAPPNRAGGNASAAGAAAATSHAPIAGAGGANTVQQLMLSTQGASPADAQEYLSVAIMMHLPITYGPHYQRAQKASVRHIKSPEGINYVQHVHRNNTHSWSAADVLVGEVYVLFLPFHRITIPRLSEEIATVQRHVLDVKKKLVTTPSAQRSRRWFLSDMLHYILPRTEMLLSAFRALLDRYSVADVVYQLSVVRLTDEANQQQEHVFEAAVEDADTAMPREVMRLSSGRFKDILHSGNLVFAINQLRELYAKKENEAAMGGGGGAGGGEFHHHHSSSPTRMRDIEREIEHLRRLEEQQQQRGVGLGGGGGAGEDVDVFAAHGNHRGRPHYDDVADDYHDDAEAEQGAHMMGGFGGMPMMDDEMGEFDGDGDGPREDGGAYRHRAPGEEAENPTAAISRNLLPPSTAQAGSSAFIRQHTMDGGPNALHNNGGAKAYKDPYSAMDLRRFVSDAYGGGGGGGE